MTKEFQDIERLKKQIQDKKTFIQKHASELEELENRCMSKEHQYMMNLFATHGVTLQDVSELVTQFSSQTVKGAEHE